MYNLPEKFLERMKNMPDFDKFMQSYQTPPERGIRVNTLKISVEEFEKISPFRLESIEWEKSGFYVSEDGGLGKTIEHAQGLYYVQEPSAMYPVTKLGVAEGDRVLDLCSAPGGKGTQIAGYLKGTGILFLNEINFKRAKVLSSNVERLGVKNTVVTCAPPEKLCENFIEYFDKILVDAPCSGEGMFKKEEQAITEWSEENVKLCAVRQSVILENSVKALSSGGTLVYSTCTFAREEDEEQVNNLLANHPELQLVEMKKLLPHEIRGEGHFYAVIKKISGGRRNAKPYKIAVKDKVALNCYRKWESETLNIKFENICAIENVLYSVPDCMPEIDLQILRCGVKLGEVLKGVFYPDHALAMCLKKGEAKFLELDADLAQNYLRGLTVSCNFGNGWCVASHNGFPLGWCKVIGKIAKNHLPKGLRI